MFLPCLTADDVITRIQVLGRLMSNCSLSVNNPIQERTKMKINIKNTEKLIKEPIENSGQNI